MNKTIVAFAMWLAAGLIARYMHTAQSLLDAQHTVARLIDKQRNERVMLSHDSWFDNERTTKRLYGARERTLQISVTDHKALMWIAQRELTIIAIVASKDSKPLSCRRIFRAVCKVKTKQRSVVRSMCCVFHRKLFQSVHVLQASLSD